MDGDWINMPEETDGYEGFVYLIQCKANGRWYVGKKLLTMAAIRTVNGKKKKIRKESKWKSYWGSCRELHQDLCKYGPAAFERRILKLCKTKWEMSYAELMEQIQRNAILDSLSYNGIINVRLRKLKEHRFENNA